MLLCHCLQKKAKSKVQAQKRLSGQQRVLPGQGRQLRAVSRSLSLCPGHRVHQEACRGLSPAVSAPRFPSRSQVCEPKSAELRRGGLLKVCT